MKMDLFIYTAKTLNPTRLFSLIKSMVLVFVGLISRILQLRPIKFTRDESSRWQRTGIDISVFVFRYIIVKLGGGI